MLLQKTIHIGRHILAALRNRRGDPGVAHLRRSRTVTVRANNHTRTAANPLPAEIQDVFATTARAEQSCLRC